MILFFPKCLLEFSKKLFGQAFLSYVRVLRGWTEKNTRKHASCAPKTEQILLVHHTYLHGGLFLIWQNENSIYSKNWYLVRLNSTAADDDDENAKKMIQNAMIISDHDDYDFEALKKSKAT